MSGLGRCGQGICRRFNIVRCTRTRWIFSAIQIICNAVCNNGTQTLNTIASDAFVPSTTTGYLAQIIYIIVVVPNWGRPRCNTMRVCARITISGSGGAHICCGHSVTTYRTLLYTIRIAQIIIIFVRTNGAFKTALVFSISTIANGPKNTTGAIYATAVGPTRHTRIFARWQEFTGLAFTNRGC